MSDDAVTFTTSELYELTSDIEEMLGVLKANETIREWWREWQLQLAQDNVPTFGGFGFVSEPSTFAYHCQFDYNGMPVFGDGSDEAQGPYRSELYATAAQVWSRGEQWAAGIGGYFRDIVAPFTKYEASSLQDTLADMDATCASVLGAVPASWKTFDIGGWYGESYTSYVTFSDQLAGSMIEKYTFLCLAREAYSGTVDLVVGMQEGLIELFRGVRDGLTAQLFEWTDTHGTPLGSQEINAKVVEAVTVVQDLAGYIPVVGGYIDKAAEIGESAEGVLNLFEVDVEISGPRNFRIESAEEVYNELTERLEAWRAKWLEGVEKLDDTSRLIRQAIVDGGSVWLPPTVDNDSPEWSHPFESPYV